MDNRSVFKPYLDILWIFKIMASPLNYSFYQKYFRLFLQCKCKFEGNSLQEIELYYYNCKPINLLRETASFSTL